MKKIYFLSVLICAIQFASFSQTVSTFETLPLAPDSYWNGSSTPLGTHFQDGHGIFPNYYDTAWGGFWQSGWAYSNIKDSVTPGYLNMYSAFSAQGADSSDVYLIGTEGSTIHLTSTALGGVVGGMYVTNSTYGALSMRDGDFIAKKFGGLDGNDPDWFKLTIKGYFQNTLIADSVEFYLADYRFTNNNLDYIVDTWQWVDLQSLGNVDSLIFSLSSSDVGMYGMNTPAFFCIDNFTSLDVSVIINKSNNAINISLYPNPATDILHIDIPKTGMQYEIFNNLGQSIKKQHLNVGLNSIKIQDIERGYYFMSIYDTTESKVFKFIKN